MRTQVFAHNGFIGIKSDIKAEGLLNNPTEPDQLGFVVDANFVDVQPQALELLKQIKRSADDLGEVDIFKSVKGTIFSWLGGPMKVIIPADVTSSNDYHPELIVANDKVETPQDFIDFINALK